MRIECADAAHGLGGLICADGGCTSPGDIAKAFGGGADFVMLGGMLAGHAKCGGELVDQNGVAKARFYGMSSRTAMDKIPVASARPAPYVGVRQLRELSKRTTSIRFTRQLNEVFGPS